MWESRWAPDQKKNNRVSGGRAAEINTGRGSELCRKQSGARREPRAAANPDQPGRAVKKLVALPVIRVYKSDYVA